MTVSSTVSKSGPYAGAGTTGPFTIGFRFLENSHLRVVKTDVNGVDTTLTLDTDYAVTGAGNPTGTVLLTVALAIGEQVTIVRDVPATQEADYVENDAFPAESHETALDKLTMLVQQNGEAISRAIKVRVSDTPLSDLPGPSARANTLIGFDSIGNVAIVPQGASTGAGDMRVDTFTAGVDFTAGVTTQLILSRAPGTAANAEVFFDTAYQGPNQWSVNGTTLTFTGAIPVGITNVFVRLGTTLSVVVPPNASVGDAQLVWGDSLRRNVNSIASLKTLDKTRYTRARTAGYYGPGAGGGNYWYDPSDTTSSDDGISVHVAADGGRWKLEVEGIVRASQAGILGNGTDMTAKAQAFLNYGITAQKIRWDVANVQVTHLDLNHALGLLIEGAGGIVGTATGTYDSVLTIRNSTDVSITGRFIISAANNINYATNLAVYSDDASGCAKISTMGTIFAACRLAWRAGLPAFPNVLIDFLTGFGGYTFGCPAIGEAYGTQTVVNVVGGINISDGGSPVPGWSSLPRIPFRTIGAQINLVGGECMLADTTTGICFCVEPIVDPIFGNSYGTIKAVGVEIESGSQLCVVRNLANVPSPAAKRGGFIMSGCSGVHTQNLFPFIDATSVPAATDFLGLIKIDGSNKFFAPNPRSFANVAVGNANVDIYVDDAAFGDGFIQGLSGIVGGNAHFSYRRIMDVQNTAGQTFGVGSQTTAKYTVVNSTRDTARFAPAYSVSTGQFTLTQALKDVEVFASLHTTTPANPLDLVVFVNGNPQTPLPTGLGGANSNGWVAGMTTLGDVASGAVIEVRATQYTGTSAGNGVQFEKFQIYARN